MEPDDTKIVAAHFDVNSERRARESTKGENWQMPRYHTRPVVIEAEHFDVDTEQRAREIANWIGKYHLGGAEVWRESSSGEYQRRIISFPLFAGGALEASLGDWIIRSQDGSFSVCDHSIFLTKYEVHSDG